MAVSITFLGHSGFLLDDGQNTVAVDPFLTGNDLAKHSPSDIRCNYVALTHGHADHFGDTLEIAKQNGATVIGAFEIANYCNEQGIENVEPGNPGGAVQTSFGSVTFTQAFHSSSYQGRYMGMPCGMVFDIGGVTFYHAGDTGLFSDMALIAELYKPDIAALPVGDRFTMDAKLATRAAEMIGPKVAIPIHYKTFGLLAQSAAGFNPKGVEVKELEPGESYRYGS
jgi:L-ascorbate metabolism protein UlaG (beta-lactamase superfamily)